MENFFDQYDDAPDKAAAVDLSPALGNQENFATEEIAPLTEKLTAASNQVFIPQQEQANLKAYVGSLDAQKKADPKRIKNDVEFSSFYRAFNQALFKGVVGGTGHFLDTLGTSSRLYAEDRRNAEILRQGGKLPSDNDRILSLNRNEDVKRMSTFELMGKLIVQYADEEDAKMQKNINAPQVWEDFRKDKFWTDLTNYTMNKAGQALGSFAPVIAGGVGGKAIAGWGGAAAGAYAGSFFMNLGDVRDNLKRAGVKSERELQQWTYVGASVLGTLDAVTPIALGSVFSGSFRRLLGESVIKKLVTVGLVSGVTEGVTEALQEGTLMFMAAEASGSEEAFKDFYIRIREAGVGGFIGGLLLGGFAGAFANKDSGLQKDIQKLNDKPKGLKITLPGQPEQPDGTIYAEQAAQGPQQPTEAPTVTPEDIKQGVKSGVQETVTETATTAAEQVAEVARQAGVPEETIQAVQQAVNPQQQATQPAQPIQESEQISNEENFTRANQHLTIAIREQGIANARAILNNANTIEEVRAIAEQSALRIPENTTDVNLAKEQALQAAVRYINARHSAASTGQSLSKRYAGIANDPGGFEAIVNSTPEERLAVAGANVEKQPLSLATVDATEDLPSHIGELNELYKSIRDENYDLNDAKARVAHNRKLADTRTELSSAILEHNVGLMKDREAARKAAVDDVGFDPSWDFDPQATDESRRDESRIEITRAAWAEVLPYLEDAVDVGRSSKAITNRLNEDQRGISEKIVALASAAINDIDQNEFKDARSKIVSAAKLSDKLENDAGPIAKLLTQYIKQADIMSAKLAEVKSTKGNARDQSRGTGKKKTNPGDKPLNDFPFIDGLNAPENSLTDILVRLSKSLGVPVRLGRMFSRKALGEVARNVNVIRHAIPNDVATISHEGGHVLHNKDKAGIDNIVTANKDELITHYQKLHGDVVYGDLNREAFAEFFNVYINNTRMAYAEMPNTYQAFEQYLENTNPDMLADFRSLHKALYEWENAPSAGRMADSIVYRTKEGGFVDEAAKIVDDFPGRLGFWADKVYTATVDRFHPMQRATKILTAIAEQNLGKPKGSIYLKAVNNPYKIARMTPRAYQTGHMDIMHGVTKKGDIDPSGPSLRDAMVHAMGGTDLDLWNQEAIQHFDQYLISKRMVLKWQLKESGQTVHMPDKDNIDVHRNTIAQYEEAFPQFVQASELLYEYNRNLLELKRDWGIITEEQYQTHVKEENYVPLLRDMRSVEEIANEVGRVNRGRKKKLNSKVIHQFVGSMRDVLSPLQSIASDTYETRMMIMRNETVKTLHRLALAAGPGGGAIAEQIPATQIIGTEVTIEEVMRQAAKMAGMGEYETEGFIMSIEDRFGDDAKATLWRATAINEKGERILYYRDKGNVVAIRLADDQLGQELYELIDFAGPEATNMAWQVAKAASFALRSGITTHPEFFGANMLRDQIGPWMLTEDHTPGLTFIEGALNEASQSVIAERMNRFGGIMGGANVSAFDDVRIKNDLTQLRQKGLKPVANYTARDLLAVSEASETATRVGVFDNAFERSLAEGLTPEEAAREAGFDTNDMMPFDLNGSKVQAIAHTIPFLNASIQGMNVAVKTARGLRDNKTIIQPLDSIYYDDPDGPVLSTAESKGRGNTLQHRFFMKFLSLAAVSLVVALINGDDEEIDEMSDYLKVTHWNIRVGDTILRYPKPFELALMANAFEAGWEALYKDDPTAAVRYLKSTFLHTVMPPTDPAILNIWRMKYNYDPFLGKAIEPEHMKRLQPADRYTPGTSVFGRAVGGAIGNQTGWSPLMVDYFVKNGFGSWGRDALRLSNLADTTGPASHWADFFISRRFTHHGFKGSRSMEKFWKYVANINGEYSGPANSYKKYTNSGLAGDEVRAHELLQGLDDGQKAYAVLDTHFNAAQKRYHPFRRARDIVTVTSGMAKEMKLAQLKIGPQNKSKVISPADKRDIIDILTQIQVREVRNSLVLEKVPGWAQKDYMDVSGFEDKLKKLYPAVHKEYQRRHRSSRGRLVIYDFEKVKKYWPTMKKKLVRDGKSANILGYR